MGKIQGRREGSIQNKTKYGEVICGPARESRSQTAAVMVEVVDAVHEPRRDVTPCLLASFVVWEKRERGDEPVDEEVPSWIRACEGTDEPTSWCQG